MRNVRNTAVVGMGIMGPDISLGFALGGCGVMAYARRAESDVDAIVQNGFALRLASIGPVRMVDYAGLDTALALMKYVYGKTGNPWFKPPKILVEKVEKGELGMKSGKGFYTYASGEVDRIRKVADETVIGVKKALRIK